jgi:hypothetical protein
MRSEMMLQPGANSPQGAGGACSFSEIRELQLKVAIIEARVSSTPITVCGRTFLSLPDVETWVVKNAPSGVFYFYHDAVSLLELMNSTDMIRSEVLTELYQAHKVGLKAEAEARMIASFRITVPQIFCGLQKESGLATSNKPFPACKTYEQWDPNDGYSGLKHMIERGMVDIRGSLMHDINTMLSAHPEARSFATDLHGLSHTFVSNYCTFLSNFYAEMRQASGCGSEEAWTLTTKAGKVVFEEFRRVRNIAANANTEPDQVKKTAKYLYATIRSHGVMAEFIERGFRDHKAIFPIINFYLFQTTAAKTTVDKFMVDIRNEMKRLDTRCNQIDSLQSKIQKLGNHPGNQTSPKKGIKGGNPLGGGNSE